MENDYLRVELNAAGDIVRLYDKTAQREILPDGAIAGQFQAFLNSNAEALEAFLSSLDEGEAAEAQLAVNLTLARLADDGGRFEDATRYFEAAVEAIPDDYRPYLAMGAFLRDKGHAGEALDVLHTSLQLSKSSAVDWRLLEELGLASNDAGKTQEAQSFLEQVIEYFTGRQVMDFPPSTATACPVR